MAPNIPHAVRELIAIGTSTTVTAGNGGSEALARFAATLFGETVALEDIISEQSLATHEPRSCGSKALMSDAHN